MQRAVGASVCAQQGRLAAIGQVGAKPDRGREHAAQVARARLYVGLVERDEQVDPIAELLADPGDVALEGLLRPEEVERILGTAEVRQLFRIPKVGTVAGCYVSDGVMQRNLPVHLVRDQVRIFSGKIASLKRFKDDAREVREGYECGISIEGYNDIKEGDLIECYRIDEVARTLAESAAASESAS